MAQGSSGGFSFQPTGTATAYDPFELGKAFGAATFELTAPTTQEVSVPAQGWWGSWYRMQQSVSVPGQTPTVGDYIKAFAGGNYNDIYGMQQLLFSANFLGKKFRKGQPDDPTLKALEKAIRLSMREQKPLDQVLIGAAQAGAAAGLGGRGGGGGGAAYVPPTAADLTAVGETAAQTELGRNLRPGEIAPVLKTEKGVEGIAATPTTYESAAATALRQAAPIEAGGQELRTALQGYLKAIQGGGF